MSERIYDIEILEAKIEEFMAGLNVSDTVRAILVVKLREASRWIEQNAITNGFIL